MGEFFFSFFVVFFASFVCFGDISAKGWTIGTNKSSYICESLFLLDNKIALICLEYSFREKLCFCLEESNKIIVTAKMNGAKDVHVFHPIISLCNTTLESFLVESSVFYVMCCWWWINTVTQPCRCELVRWRAQLVCTIWCLFRVFWWKQRTNLRHFPMMMSYYITVSTASASPHVSNHLLSN